MRTYLSFIARARILLVATLLGALPARAHAVEFNFVVPSGAGNRTDGGQTGLQWTDFDALGTATFSLFATRRAYAPFEVPNTVVDVAITTGDLSVASPVDVYRWNTSGLPAGCYQPYARMRDPVEGDTYRMGIGSVSVFAAGQNVPPSVWLTNNLTDTPNPNGLFAIHYKVDDPDDSTVLTVKYLNASTRATGTIGAPVVLPIGGGSGTVTFDVTQVSNAPYYLYAQVQSDDGRNCDAYSPTYFYVSNPYDGGTQAQPTDAGPDAGLDAGLDAGVEGATDGGTPPKNPPRGCGCGAGPHLVLVSPLLLLQWPTDN